MRVFHRSSSGLFLYPWVNLRHTHLKAQQTDLQPYIYIYIYVPVVKENTHINTFPPAWLPQAPPQLSVVQASQGFFLMELMKEKKNLLLVCPSLSLLYLKTHTPTYQPCVSCFRWVEKPENHTSHYMRFWTKHTRQKHNCPHWLDWILTWGSPVQPHHKVQMESHVLALISLVFTYCVSIKLYNVDLA